MPCLGSSHPAYDHLGARPTTNLVRSRSRGSKTWHHVTCNLLGGERQKQVTPENHIPLDKCNVVWHPLKRVPKVWKNNRTASGRAKSNKFQHLDRDKRRESKVPASEVSFHGLQSFHGMSLRRVLEVPGALWGSARGCQKHWFRAVHP